MAGLGHFLLTSEYLFFCVSNTHLCVVSNYFLDGVMSYMMIIVAVFSDR